MRYFLSLIAGMVITGTALAQQTPHAAAPKPGELRHAQLREVASGKIFNQINRNDVRAALTVWFNTVGHESGYQLDSHFDIADSVAEIRERLLSHSVEILALSITDYLELERSRLLVPVVTEVRTAQGGAPYSYVLLVNPASGINTLAGLRGKKVLVASRSSENTGGIWLAVLLGKDKLGRAAAFLDSVKNPDKAQACILPLFFGAADACVVDEISLNLAKEMNPQLGRLSVLARSRPIIESLVAVPADPQPYQNELIDSMLHLHENPTGRQLLMVFKTTRMVRIQPGDFDAVRELWSDYSRLPGEPPKRPPGSGSGWDGHPAGRGEDGSKERR